MSVLVIGEAGSNHCGDVNRAIELVDVAKEAGCDVVKFQAIDLERVWVDPTSRPKWTQQGAWFFERVAGYCEALKIEFMCTPFSAETVAFLNPLVKRWKVASAHAEDNALWVAMQETMKTVYMSLGYVAPGKARQLVQRPTVLEIVPLVCSPRYPSAPEDYALQMWAGALWPHEWGVSDHTVGYGMACAAVGLGATVVEKHFKLEEQPDSPDDGPHALYPDELADFVATVREADAARNGTWVPAKRPEGRRVYVR